MVQWLLSSRKFGAHRLQKFYNYLAFIIGLITICASAQAGEVKLYAAASLTDVLTELSNMYQKNYPNIVIKKSFSGSATLAKQIENGAPADIFISADNDWADYLSKRGLLVADLRKTLLSNELVFIAPAGSAAKVTFAAGFNLGSSFSGRLCTGDTASVPVGKYAKQSLIHYGWWDSISPRIVGTDDVRTALVFVERAECSLGIVYRTDAQLSKKVKVVAVFPAASHSAIEYSGGLLKNATADSKIFWEFLQSSDAKAVFSRYGFIPLN